jgi:hypothetical protein
MRLIRLNNAMKRRVTLVVITALATFATACWAIGPTVKHDRLYISDLIKQSIGVFYTNRGGAQAFDVMSFGIVSFESGDGKAWLLPVLNGNADDHPLRSGSCDILIYKADSDYVTPIQMTPTLLGGVRDGSCAGFRRPLIVAGGSGVPQLVIYPTIYLIQPKVTVWRVLAYDTLDRSFCYATEASVSLTKAASATSINESNVKSVLDALHLPADAFTCTTPKQPD